MRRAGAVREGCALLQGLATCGCCGRRLTVHYHGARSSPGYHCTGRELVAGRGVTHLSVGGVQIDHAVTAAFLAAIAPAGIHASVAAAETMENDRDAALDQWRLEVERARYEAQRAERRYLAVDPDNRLVARGLETDWEEALARCATPKPNSTACAGDPGHSPPNGHAAIVRARRRHRPGLVRRPPPPTGTAKNCCAPFSRK